MYYSLQKYSVSGSEVFIDTGNEDIAIRAACIEMETIQSQCAVICASEYADDCQPTHIIINDVVYRLQVLQRKPDDLSRWAGV